MNLFGNAAFVLPQNVVDPVYEEVEEGQSSPDEALPPGLLSQYICKVDVRILDVLVTH